MPGSVPCTSISTCSRACLQGHLVAHQRLVPKRTMGDPFSYKLVLLEILRRSHSPRRDAPMNDFLVVDFMDWVVARRGQELLVVRYFHSIGNPLLFAEQV